MHWPPDEFMFIKIVHDSHIQASSTMRRSSSSPVSSRSSAARLPGARAKSGTVGAPVPIRRARRLLRLEHPGPLSRCDCVQAGRRRPRRVRVPLDWSASRWSSWDSWLERVVWWRNRAGQYFLKEGLRAVWTDAGVAGGTRCPPAITTDAEEPSGSERARRFLLVACTAVSLSLLGRLAMHVSFHARVLGRYSVPYSALLLAVAGTSLATVLLHHPSFYRRVHKVRWPAVLVAAAAAALVLVAAHIAVRVFNPLGISEDDEETSKLWLD